MMESIRAICRLAIGVTLGVGAVYTVFKWVTTRFREPEFLLYVILAVLAYGYLTL